MINNIESWINVTALIAGDLGTGDSLMLLFCNYKSNVIKLSIFGNCNQDIHYFTLRSLDKKIRPLN